MASVRPIQPLPDHVINQIAAGEVIDRPASIVKELIDNSLDAGANAIRIDVAGGGLERIAVVDDGRGIPAGELRLALSRHCTSKLRTADDLTAMSTLGFRGEALASIASVACLALRSRVASEVHGCGMTSAGGNERQAPAPVAHPVGTSIEVTDLFFNLPARRKFLKRPLTEFLHIQQLVRQVAFCHPQVRIDLAHDGRQVYALPAGTEPAALQRRLDMVFGRTFCRHAVAVDAQAGEVGLHGWLGAPTDARSQSDLQFLAVNGRVVRDRHVLHAIRLAYETSIEIGRHPCFALHIDLPPGLVDVNVHPAKTEVRFREARQLHDAVFAACRRALQGSVESAGSASTEAGWMREPAGRYTVPTSVRAPAHGHGARVAGAFPGAAGRHLQLVGQRWIVELSDQSLRITDARAVVAALARALFDLAAGRVERRPLLVPVTVRTSGASEAMLASLAELGFELSALGPHDCALRSIPVRMPAADPDMLAMALGSALATRNDAAALPELLVSVAVAAWRPPTGAAGIEALLAANSALAEPVAAQVFGPDWPALLVDDDA